MNSLRLLNRSSLYVQRLAPRAISGATTPFFICNRSFASVKRQIDATTAMSERQSKTEFSKMLNEESSILRTQLEEEADNNGVWEVQTRFLQETDFKVFKYAK